MWLGIKNVIMANHMMSLITSSTTDPWGQFKSVDRENEVKVMLHMSGWHIHIMINVWNKYGEVGYMVMKKLN
jgi:hypothetical protein